MKRIVFCFDGTWNKLNADCPTNVVLTAEMIIPVTKNGTVQMVYYDEGVGTGRADKVRGGAFGAGLMNNIREAYRFLIFNYQPGDEIFAFGFSRGAFTARSFLGFIRHAGILNVNVASQIDKAVELYKDAMRGDGDDHRKSYEFRANYSSQICVSKAEDDWRSQFCDGYESGSAPVLKIKYLGVWDTVGSLGWPSVLPFSNWLNNKYGFHDIALSSKVESARHAVAIDERRKLYRPSLWNNVVELNERSNISHYSDKAPYQQKWFPGTHGSVGGGGPERGLSDQALAWILKGAKDAKLRLNTEDYSRAYEIKPNYVAPLLNAPQPWHERSVQGVVKRFFLNTNRIGPTDINDVSAFARRRWAMQSTELPENKIYRPKTLSEVSDLMEIIPFPAAQSSDEETMETKGFAEHIVIANDTLSKLAIKYYGDQEQYIRIFDANRDRVDDPEEIFVGMALRIPLPIIENGAE